MAKPGKTENKKQDTHKSSSIDARSARQYLKRQKTPPDVETLTQGILAGNRILLSQAITLIESENPLHQNIAQQIIENCLPHAGNSIRIGITGSPGVGKSTFIEAFGTHLTSKARTLAVLAIDPSSQLSRGSILGDKTRMSQLSVHPKAFIRPSPAGTSLGGVARKTRESMILCEVAGFDTIIVETVGVGQSETAVHSMVDCFLLLLLPGAGDELQGIKRGIVEMADLLLVNKADGDRLAAAKLTRRQYRNSLHLFPPKPNNWTPKVLTCSALDQTGIAETWTEVLNFQHHTQENGFFKKNRRQQAKDWFNESLKSSLTDLLFKNELLKEQLKQNEESVIKGEKSPFRAAKEIIEAFLKTNKF